MAVRNAEYPLIINSGFRSPEVKFCGPSIWKSQAHALDLRSLLPRPQPTKRTLRDNRNGTTGKGSPIVINGVSHVLFLLLTTEQRTVGLHEFTRQQETIDNGDAVGNEIGNELALAA